MSLRPRIIPVLLLHKGGLVKTVKFNRPTYVGDPINAVKIFNEKEVDELVVLDIDAFAKKDEPDYVKIKEIVSEAFMPIGYGGGITNFEQACKLFQMGIEKVIINAALFQNIGLIRQIADTYGNQSVVASIDYKKTLLGGNKVFYKNGTVNAKTGPLEWAEEVACAGAGEIIINSIDRDGTYTGYDLDLLKHVSQKVKIPVVVCGGASSVEDFKLAYQHGASGMAAGSMFVFQQPHRAVLISYPTQKELKEKLYT